MCWSPNQDDPHTEAMISARLQAASGRDASADNRVNSVGVRSTRLSSTRTVRARTSMSSPGGVGSISAANSTRVAV